ncbi:unnamed protein product, partial [Ectocarpus sp. 12 AP-2014]
MRFPKSPPKVSAAALRSTKGVQKFLEDIGFPIPVDPPAGRKRPRKPPAKKQKVAPSAAPPSIPEATAIGPSP